MQVSPRHIAVIRTDRLGDMVLTLPMFPALRSLFPTAKLTLIASPYVEPLVRSVECIDDVIYLDEGAKNLRSILRQHRVDTLFAPRPRASEAWAALAAGVRTRVGSGYRWYSFLYNHQVREHRSDARFHEAEYNVRMIMHAFGCAMPTVELVSPRDLLQRSRTKTRPRVILHPGSGGSARDWPAERFGMLGRELQQQRNAEILVTGIASEHQLCSAVIRECPGAMNMCGQFDLDGMIDLIASADLLVSNSTGVLHVAAALGLAVLGLYPSTPSMSAGRWGPYTTRAIVLESGVGDDMLSISVEDAAKAAVKLLEQP